MCLKMPDEEVAEEVITFFTPPLISFFFTPPLIYIFFRKKEEAIASTEKKGHNPSFSNVAFLPFFAF